MHHGQEIIPDAPENEGNVIMITNIKNTWSFLYSLLSYHFELIVRITRLLPATLPLSCLLWPQTLRLALKWSLLSLPRARIFFPPVIVEPIFSIVYGVTFVAFICYFFFDVFLRQLVLFLKPFHFLFKSSHVFLYYLNPYNIIFLGLNKVLTKTLHKCSYLVFDFIIEFLAKTLPLPLDLSHDFLFGELFEKLGVEATLKHLCLDGCKELFETNRRIKLVLHLLFLISFYQYNNKFKWSRL